jgi:hypothetical protein
MSLRRRRIACRTRKESHMKPALLVSALCLAGLATAPPAWADPFAFNNGNVTDGMGAATRPDTHAFEIETGDDFLLGSHTQLNGASFTGLVPSGASVSQVVVEIYRVFPKDSTTPPSGHVTTRTNSPSDVAFDSRDSADSTLAFSTATLAATFSTLNSIQPGGIHALPGTTTGGNGPATGQEVRFDVTFATPFDLPPDHYFFVPQVDLTDGSFLWLSSVRPIVAPGTPFAPDLQAWTRDANLDPDWVRIGTDIVGGTTPPTFNLAFSLEGETVAAIPEPETWALMLGGLAVLGARRRRR